MLGRSLHLNAVYSDFMRLFFRSESLTSKRFDALVCEELKIDESARIMFPSTLQSLLGDSRLTWDMNSHLLLEEAKTSDNRNLVFDWHPILREDVVDEVLVIVRDVTEISKLRIQSKVREAEFEYYLAFSRMNRQTVLQMQTNLQRLHNEAIQLSTQPSDSENWTRSVLICLHTLKGNFRQSGLNSLANQTHETEQAIIDLKADARKMEQSVEYLNGFVRDIEQSLASIRLVIERLYTGLAPVAPDQALTLALREQFRSLWAQHQSSKHREPELIFNGPIDVITSPLREALIDAWPHLVTNSFDHGLETSDPDLVFRIHFSVHHHQNELILEYSDSGPGLPIDRIYEKAKYKDLLSESFTPTPDNIARLIFEPGFSTRDEVSQSSGRGIGMDAVKTRLEMAGARVEIKLQAQGQDPTFYPFLLRVHYLVARSHS